MAEEYGLASRKEKSSSVQFGSTKQKIPPELNNIIGESEEHKTIEFISRRSIKNVHRALRNITGENYNNFEIRFKILHAMCTKASKPFLKLEEIHHITGIPINEISNHLKPLKDGDLLNNKGGQDWRVTSKGRRLLDNITILLFENSGDFDDIDLINASIRHLNVFAKFYGLDLKINSRIVRYFDYIISELEDQPIELLDSERTRNIRQLLRKIDSFYNHLRVQLYQSSKIEFNDTWTILDRLAKRHNIVSDMMLKLNKHITNLGAHLDIQEALSHYLALLNPQKVLKNYGLLFQFNSINISSQFTSKNLVENMKGVIFNEPNKAPPNFNVFPYRLISEGQNQEDIEEEIEVLRMDLKKISKKTKIRIRDIIDFDNWEESATKLIQLARLSSNGEITLSNNVFLNLEGKQIKFLLDSEVFLNF